MCEYCRGLASDDYDQECLFQIPVIFGFGSSKENFQLTGDLGYRGLYISFGQKGYEDVAYETIPIKYCPMCGESYKNLRKPYKEFEERLEENDGKQKQKIL